MDQSDRHKPGWKRLAVGLLGAVAGILVGGTLGFLLEWALLPVYRVVNVAPKEGTGTTVFLVVGAFFLGVIGGIVGTFVALILFIQREERKPP
jgi:hypothetical protein